MRVAALSLAALLTSGCAATVEKPTWLVGHWGGPHAGVAANVTAEVQFDCASGTIDVPIYPAKDGTFEVKGTYREGSPGPVRVGQIFRSQAATYSGTVTEQAMTFDVELEDGSHVGPFNLAMNAPPQLTRCL